MDLRRGEVPLELVILVIVSLFDEPAGIHQQNSRRERAANDHAPIYG
jgi:hypothetical protein